MKRLLLAFPLVGLLGCSGGGGSSSPPAPAAATVKWAQPTYIFGGTSTWTGLATVNVTGGPPTLGVNLVDLDVATPGGPTHTNSSVFTGSNGTVTVPFYPGVAKGTWRFRADLVIGGVTTSDTVNVVVQ